MEEMLINPMSLVGMSTYHTKNVPGNVGVSFGLLYALQEELTYKLALTSPLGVGTTPVATLIANMVEYENLRLRKGKNNMNYYEEFILVGWYVMGSQKFMEQRVADELNKAFQERGASYSLYYFVGLEFDSDPKLMKAGREVKYRLEIDPLQKYCIDALSFQESKKESVLAKTLNKEKHLLDIYNEKLQKLSELLAKTTSDDKKRQILQLLETYDRMDTYSRAQKQKTIQAINYSVLTGLILTHHNDPK
jgi:hypothetical protein